MSLSKCDVTKERLKSLRSSIKGLLDVLVRSYVWSGHISPSAGLGIQISDSTGRVTGDAVIVSWRVNICGNCELSS